MDYQTGGVAVRDHEVDEDGQVSIVLPQFSQCLEHSIIINLSLRNINIEVNLSRNFEVGESFEAFPFKNSIVSLFSLIFNSFR